MAVECGLKRLMIAFGMTLDPSSGSPRERDDRMHADGIWARFESYRSCHRQGAGYALPTQNPFQDWGVSQRYAHQSNFDQARAQRHQRGAQTIRDLVRQAQREGLL